MHWIYSLKGSCIIKVSLKPVITAWKVFKYRVYSGPYFPALAPGRTPYADTFHAVNKKTHNLQPQRINVYDNIL